MFLPLTFLGQESQCCENVREVKKFLHGHWKKEGGDPGRLYEFNFSGETAKAVIYDVTGDGSRQKIRGSEAAISVSNENNDLFLVYDWKHSIIEQQVIYLDTARLTLSLGAKRIVKLYKVQ